MYKYDSGHTLIDYQLKAPERPVLEVLRLSPSARIPQRATPQSAGYDLYASTFAVVPAKGKELVKIGIAIAIPPGYYGRVAPRSGLALKNFIDVGAGVVDIDYRGELGVVLFNFSDADFKVSVGDRIAQLLIEKISHPRVIEVKELRPVCPLALASEGTESELGAEQAEFRPPPAARGTGGFGSTGGYGETE